MRIVASCSNRYLRDEKLEAYKRLKDQIDFDAHSFGMLCGNGFEIRIQGTVNDPSLLSDSQFLNDCKLLFGEYNDEV